MDDGCDDAHNGVTLTVIMTVMVEARMAVNMLVMVMAAC